MTEQRLTDEQIAAAIAAIDVMQRAAKENAARADALEAALRELVDLCELCDISEDMPDDGYGWKLAYIKARSLINPTGGES